MGWMILPLKRYADFSGRSRRKEYWMFQLLNVIVMVLLIALMVAGGASGSVDDTSGAEAGPGALFAIGMGLFVLWWLAILIPTLAVTVRRFHDHEKSGWMFLINFIPVVGGWIVLFFMVQPGTRGDNSYGPDPKGEFDVTTFE